ncbi:MAG: hypothetical protein HC854_15690 [Flavobacterium sp.]|nr:hypothetical protein [Flavobacterium sp.]
MKTNCYCGSTLSFNFCCETFITKISLPKHPEQLMRSRYSAYVLHNADYLIATTHHSKRKFFDKKEILHWAKANTWIKLEILKAEENQVEFKAYYLDERLQAQIHHEKSTFKQEKDIWYYVDGIFY